MKESEKLPKEIQLDSTIDDESEESAEECPTCRGEGIMYSQDMNDEEDRDFVTCTTCGGSGEVPDEDDDILYES